jgi:ABC-type Na+ efflux pump permease subunit
MVWNIFKWEIGRITSNWKRSAAVLLLPAVLMVLAINVFPMLINYLSTGTLGKSTVYIVDAPDSFADYIEEIEGRTAYRIKMISQHEFDETYSGNTLKKSLKKGEIFVTFSSSEDIDFDSEIERYYSNLAKGYSGAISHAAIILIYDGSSFVPATRAEGFTEVVLNEYEASLPERLGGDYSFEARDAFSVDTFNPVVTILDHRTEANSRAGDVVPGIMVLLMYYCVYSLSCDLFAAEKDRGFFNKLLLTPVSGKAIVYGKILCIMAISTVSAVITLVFMFLASWLNTSNDATSLIPFGMLLTPSQLLKTLLAVITGSFMMSTTTTYTVFSLRKLQDTVINLQFPLVLFLFDFFFMMLRGNRPWKIEYLMPMHNTICIIRDIFWSEERTWALITVSVISLIWGSLVLKKLFKKEIFI